MTLPEAQEIAEKIKSELAPFCIRIEIAGSIRRCKPDNIKDIELVVIVDPKKIAHFAQHVVRWNKVKGEPTGKYTQRILPGGTVLDLFMANENNWGYIFAIRTGSAEYSHKILANGWVKKGYRGKEGILYKNNTPVPVKEEEDLFELIGIPFVEPKKREV